MVRFTLNGKTVSTEGGRSLLSYLRDEARLTAAKNGCGEGACGSCSVIADGKLVSSCVTALERMEGKSVLTVEGIEESEMLCYERAFAEAGAVQCGYCTPGMVLAAKALLDRNPRPGDEEVRAGLRKNLCRCTGYVKIVEGVHLAARFRRDPGLMLSAARQSTPSPSLATGGLSASNSADYRGSPRPPSPSLATGIGTRLQRVDARVKVRGEAQYVDDLVEPGMFYGAALRSPYARAKLVSLDVSAARTLAGVALVATWEDIPGSRFTGHVVSDWPTLVAVGEETRYVGDAVALVAAETPARAREALALIVARYDVLTPVASPQAALAPGAPLIHPAGNILSRLSLGRGDPEGALAAAAHLVEETFTTPFTDHAFLEPESALAYPPDADGTVLVRTGEQNVYDGQRYVADTLGIPRERVRIVSEYVGGGFGGKEDQTVQHHSALLAWLCGWPVKCTLDRAESTRVHVKRHPMTVRLRLGCDQEGRLVGLIAEITADTGAYASLGGPVLHRAVTHAGGPYRYDNIRVSGMAVHTNNPPAGAFRGFGVPQVTFALESALDLLAARAGMSAWEIRFRNAVRPGDLLPNGQAAGPDTALLECLLAVKEAYEAGPGTSGIACGFKNTGLGMGHPDIGRCVLKVAPDHVQILTGAACMGQGLATVLTQVACEILDIDPALVRVVQPDTATTPNSGTSTASRQTLITGEACRRACEAAREEARGLAGMDGARNASFPLALLAGREYRGSYEAATDPFETDRPASAGKPAAPVHHIAYSYACQVAILGPDRRVQRIVAAHDSGLVVNPLAFEGQVEGGVVMGLGSAVTEELPLTDCAPTARFGQLGLLRATDAPSITTLIVRKAGPGSAIDGGVSGGAFGAKGIGEISLIPTAAAVAGAYFALDGKLRTDLPLRDTPYRPGP